jgi:RNA polymerase sigma-70 factor, ECF subfamily
MADGKPQGEPKRVPMAAVATDIVPTARGGFELESLFRAHQSLVLRAAYRVTGSMTDAEDVLQTVFLRLAGRDFASAVVGNMEGYLHRAAVNAALDIIRSRQDARNTPLEDAPEPTATSAFTAPDRAQASAEIREWLRIALLRLSPRAAEVFALRYLEELDNQEIARLLKVTETSIGVLLHRTRAQLQKDYQKNMRGEK